MSNRCYSFKKAEKLCSKKVINNLFKDKAVNKIVKFPLIFIWKEFILDTEFPIQVLLSVSKKLHKKAVIRNKIKRQIREIYRSRKHLLYDQLELSQKQIALIIIYAGKQSVKYSDLEICLDEFVKEFIKRIR